MSNISITARKLALLGALVTLHWSSTSRAESTKTQQSGAGDYEYSFVDDDLLGSTLGNSGDIFRGRAGFHRVLLLRPRTAFVVQLFKSVENL
jgi:hypothetical protein